MKRVRLTRSNDFEYRADVLRIQDALMQAGYLAYEHECREMWERFSDSMAAGWMHVPDDDAEIVASVAYYFTATEDR